MFTFTRDKKLSVVSGSNEKVMAYTGSFDLNDNILSINVKSCVVREMEGKTIAREISPIDGKNLVIISTSSDNLKKTTLTWRKIVNL